MQLFSKELMHQVPDITKAINADGGSLAYASCCGHGFKMKEICEKSYLIYNI